MIITFSGAVAIGTTLNAAFKSRAFFVTAIFSGTVDARSVPSMPISIGFNCEETLLLFLTLL